MLQIPETYSLPITSTKRKGIYVIAHSGKITCIEGENEKYKSPSTPFKVHSIGVNTISHIRKF